MTSLSGPLPGEDLVGFLRSYTDQAFDGTEDLASLWDRHHTPDSTHAVNQRGHDRTGALKLLRKWRQATTPYDLRIHQVVVDGNRAAARYTLTSDLLLKVTTETEILVFHTLADDGRIASSIATSRNRYTWGTQQDVWDADATPAASDTAFDVSDYLTEYSDLAADPDHPAGEVIDRFFTPDCVQRINRQARSRAHLVANVHALRKKSAPCTLQIHETLRHGDSYAARYALHPVRKKVTSPAYEVYELGDLAADGRVRALRAAVQTPSGNWPF